MKNITFQTLMAGLIAIAAALSPLTAHAAAGTTGAAFLDIPTGAGPAAMGSAYSALANDAYAPVWNPGGLGFLPTTEVAAQHLSYLEGTHAEFLSLTHPFRPGRALGIAVQYFGSGDIDSTLPSGAPNGTYSTHYAAFSLAYGQRLAKNWAFGATGKWLSAKIADVSAHAYAADLGVMYLPSPTLTTALVVTNLGSALRFIKEGDALPLAVKLGAAWRPTSRWIASAESVYQHPGMESFHTGGEFRPLPYLSLRAGYQTDTLHELSPMAGLAVGGALRWLGQEFAYTWRPMDVLGSTHYFSLLLKFGAETPARLHRTSVWLPEILPTDDPDKKDLIDLFESEGTGRQRTAAVPGGLP